MKPAMKEITAGDRTLRVRGYRAMHMTTAGYTDRWLMASMTVAVHVTAPVTKRRAPLPERTRDENY